MGKGSQDIPETPEGKAAAEVAVDQYNTYMKEYRPFENKFIADVMRPTDVREAKAAGAVNADIMQKMPAATGPRINPATYTRGAEVGARAINNVTQAVKDQKVAGMQAITDMGMGKESKAQLGLDTLSSNAANRAINEETAAQTTGNAMTRGISGLAGAGAAVYNNTPSSPLSSDTTDPRYRALTETPYL